MLPILQLLPTPQVERPLEGLFLEHDLGSQIKDDRPYLYANFITSLDGRIAVPDDSGDLVLPGSIKNDRDWRLFQELAVQADLLFTSGRYLREYAEGKSQEILEVYDDPEFADLRDWREARGLSPYPDLAVISRSGHFPIPAPLRSDDRRVHVVTTRSADSEQLRALADQGRAEICIAGEESVDAGWMVRELAQRGYRLMYNTAGPQVMHLLLSAGVLDRLYLTWTGRLLGGSEYATILEGDPLNPPADFELSRLYLDREAFDRCGQLFSVFDRR